jgi:amino acid adenylation domain-containing protein
MAAWAILLSRFSAQETVLFGISIGSASTRPLQLTVDPGRTLRSWLREVSTQVTAVGHAASSHVSHFETVIALTPHGGIPEGTPLVIEILESESELEIVSAYDDCFAEGAIPRVLESLETLLEDLALNQGKTVSELSFVGQDQLNQQLILWNETQTPYPNQSCIHELLKEQVSRSPHQTALTFHNRNLSYLELDQQSTLLAHELCKLGAGPESVIGICMERSVEMIIGLLSILKSGAAYLPLDPAYPLDRLQFMLQDSEALLLLTQDHLAPRFGDIPQKILKFDSKRTPTSGPVGPVPGKTPESSNLAYVIYTSGSTGRPKGVMIEHRQVMNLFTGMDRVIGPEPGVWLAVTSVSFDISVLELFWTLARGFHVVVLPEEEKLTTTGDFSIPAQIARHSVSHLQCTPSMARVLVSSPAGLKALGSVKKLLIGGEALPSSLAKELTRATGGKVYNMYGPTETTVWSTTYQLAGHEHTIPIGRPIANTSVYILDRYLKPVPIGAPGELCIGGAGVARGYLKQPELSSEKFPENPFQGAGTQRIYRTGDLARYRPNGDLEYLGRIDNQIKVLGFRVEMEEIENALCRHPGVRAAAVVPKEKTPGEVRLVAYIVPGETNSSLSKDLRVFLQQKLPLQVIPSAFVFLDSLPSTPNGKVDRKALAALREVPENLLNGSTPADMEDLISGIWGEALGVDTISTSQNLFDLGATSMLMLEVTARLCEACGREILITDLFRYPTISALAAHLSNPRDDHGRPDGSPSRRGAVVAERVERGIKKRLLERGL